ncbi:MAG: MmcQ/YjbR family DNA-binding protein [Elusimicrobia bacterium]|nr:MmcQ/YjbR family DNA-binding protein [Elusimicrobiota bacterium]
MGRTSGEERELKRLRDLCMAIPGTAETSSWGHANWRAGKKKIYAEYEETRGAQTLSIFVGAGNVEDFLEDRRFALPRYTDHHGWVCLRLDRSTDWNEVKSLIRAAHALVTAVEPAGGSV